MKRVVAGVHVQSDSSIEVNVWAPFKKKVDLKIVAPIEKIVPMDKCANGYHTVRINQPIEIFDYYFILDEEHSFPDPASHWQPQGVVGPSRVYPFSQFHWEDSKWKGIPLKEAIIYEIHVGTFTPAGTFQGIIDKIPYFKEMGINTIELMPVATFSGDRNWGYDGVYLYAPHECYGGPKGLQELVNRCHQNNIAVVMDVVYNHLGPEGNFLHEFGPYFTEKYSTPWGSAINYDESYSLNVREFVINNALHWLEKYHIDGLRLDAIHAIFDQSAYPILEELADRFHDKAKLLGKDAWLIAESDLNDPKYVQSKKNMGIGLDAQWNDDFHHCLEAYVGKKSFGYFRDYGSIYDLTKAITEGFVQDGKWSEFRQRYHGKPSTEIPLNKLVNFLQNHDQIANASQGKRIASYLDIDQLMVTATILMLSPGIPMLFMGQEWGTNSPFYFFTSFTDEALGKAVTQGRKEEYASLGVDGNFHDPQQKETFFKSKLDWSVRNESLYKQVSECYKSLISLRKNQLQDIEKSSITTFIDKDNKSFLISYSRDSRPCLHFAVNLSRKPVEIGINQKTSVNTLLFSTKEPSLSSSSLLFEPMSASIWI